MTRLTRRDFFKSGAAGAVAAGTIGSASAIVEGGAIPDGSAGRPR